MSDCVAVGTARLAWEMSYDIIGNPFSHSYIFRFVKPLLQIEFFLQLQQHKRERWRVSGARIHRMEWMALSFLVFFFVFGLFFFVFFFSFFGDRDVWGIRYTFGQGHLCF